MPLQQGLQHFGFVDILHRHLQDVLVDDDEISLFARLDGAGHVFLLHIDRAVAGKDLDRGLDVDPLTSGKARSCWP